MAEVKIDIPGIGEVVAQNAASEQTLKDILKALGGTGRGAGGPGGGSAGAGVGSGVNLKTKKAQEGLDEVGESAYSASGALSKIASAGMGLVSGAFNTLLSTVTGVVGGIANLGAEALQGSVRISDYARHIPVVGQIATAFDKQLDTFRELSSAGASFGNDMFDLSVVAGRSAIPIQDFTELVGSNSEALRRFGGTVSGGITTFGRLAKEMRQGAIGQQLMGMGLTTKELNENLINYNEMMLYMGKKEQMTDQQLIAGAQAYSFELDRIAKITGRNRKEIEDEMNARKDNVFMQAAIANMTQEEALKFQGALRLLPPGMEGFEDALVDMSDGKAFTPLARNLSVMSETFKNKAANIKNMKPEEIVQFYQDVEKDLREHMGAYGDDQEQFLRSLADTNPELFAVFENMGKLKGITLASGEAAEKEQKARDKFTTTMATQEEGLASVLGAFKADLLESEMFQDFKGMVADLLPTIDEMDDMYKKAQAAFNKYILPEIEELQKWFASPEGGQALIKNIKTFFNDAFVTYLPLVKEKLEAFVQFFQDMSDPEKRKEFLNNLVENLKTGFVGMIADFDWTAMGVSILGLITAGFLKLNPFGAVASLIISGVVGFIGWDNIKEFFSKNELGKKIGAVFSNIVEGFVGLFGFDIEFPNFGDYLPKWLGGGGKPLKELFGFGDSTDTTSNTKAPKVDEAVAEEEVNKASETKSADSTGATSKKATASNEVTEQLVLLNKNVLDLMEINRKHLRATEANSETV